MKKNQALKAIAINTIREEANAITNLIKSVDNGFLSCVDLILHSKGRVIITGIGKSAIIGQKIVAPLNLVKLESLDLKLFSTLKENQLKERMKRSWMR